VNAVDQSDWSATIPGDNGRAAATPSPQCWKERAVASTGTGKLTARQAAHLLAGRDPVIARLIAETGEFTFPTRWRHGW
jgi:hypothetical protein